MWFDDAALRNFWTNFHPVARGRPIVTRFVKLKAMGIRTVLNLRGAAGSAHYLVEEKKLPPTGPDPGEFAHAPPRRPKIFSANPGLPGDRETVRDALQNGVTGPALPLAL